MYVANCYISVYFTSLYRDRWRLGGATGRRRAGWDWARWRRDGRTASWPCCGARRRSAADRYRGWWSSSANRWRRRDAAGPPPPATQARGIRTYVILPARLIERKLAGFSCWIIYFSMFRPMFRCCFLFLNYCYQASYLKIYPTDFRQICRVGKTVADCRRTILS